MSISSSNSIHNSIHNSINKRARTDEQKQFRRQAILNAADAQFHDLGFAAFSMAKLAQRAGLAKGTLYLYFETREEVLLALVNTKLANWSARLSAVLHPGMSDRQLAMACYLSVLEDPALLPLLTRLDSVIEHNVSIDALITSKRALRRVLENVAASIAIALDLPGPASFELVTAISALLMGATRVDLGPSLVHEDLPDDVRELIQAYSSKDLFVNNACRIIAGIRAENSTISTRT